MAVFKFVISEPTSRKSIKVEVDQDKAAGLIGKRIGDEFNGDIIGLSGYVLKITGGTDKDGFPMHPSLKGSSRQKLLLSGPPGFHPLQKGQRKRKMVRGDTISEDVVQINAKVVKMGEKPFDQLAPKKEVKEAAKEEAKGESKETKEEPEKEPREEEPKEVIEKPVEKKNEEEKRPEEKSPAEENKPAEEKQS